MAKAVKIARGMALLLVSVTLIFVMAACQNVMPTWDYDWEDNGDMETIRARMIDDLYDDKIDPLRYVGELKSDGSFESIDYYTDEKDTWHPIFHLDYILAMQSAAYSSGNKYYLNEKLIASINKAIAFWVEKDFRCEWNGWWNGLGSCPKIANILMYPNNGLDVACTDMLTQKLYTATCFDDGKKYNVREREIDSTGGNLTDMVNHSLKYAVLKKDGSGIKFLRRLMENELRPFQKTSIFQHRYDAEGIKADMSFQQHFEMLYVGGYGEVFAGGMNTFIRYTLGTQFGLSEDSLNFYQDFLLDGMQYSMRGKYRDINASGRGIVRKDKLVGIQSEIEEGCKVLLATKVHLTRIGELVSFIVNRTAENDVGAGGHKYFWASDYQVYNDKNYMASVRAASKRTKNSESLNGENVWGHYLGAGATMYYIEGDEYYNIPPLMDWNKVPGTTTIQGFLPYGADNTYSRMGKTNFVGGASTGKVGLSCLDYTDNKVKAKKSWFMFEDGVVCLGTDISSKSGGELYTTINQTLQRGDIEYGQNGKKYSAGNLSLSAKVDWVYNNGIGYICGEPLVITAKKKTGDWKSISERVSVSDFHSDNVLELGLSHGAKARNGKYDYTVLMNTSGEKLIQYLASPNLITLSNDRDCQAVYDSKNGIIMATFWNRGELTLKNGVKLKVNKGCTLIYDEGEQMIYVSDPLQKSGKIKIDIGNKSLTLELPKGMYAGQTVKGMF